jgi:short-subunit dehydrogenase
VLKKAIVVGATSGIGKSVASILVENNYQVGITGRRKQLLEEIKNENTHKYFIKAFDVSQTNEIAANLNELVSELGGLDLLIISSGTGDINNELDFDIEKTTINTNVAGFTAVADWSFNYFQQHKHGHLVGISSIGGLRGNRQAPSYSASKAFQINYLESLRIKAVNLKIPIFITDIRPGFVDTQMAKGEGLFWVLPVEKAAKQLFKAIQDKRKISYLTSRWKFMAILLKLAPRFLIEKM